MPAPPGVVFILRHVPFFVIPSALTYAVLKTVQLQTSLDIHPFLLILLSIIAHPVLFFVQYFYSEWQNQREAAVRGAVVAPRVEGSMLSILKTVGDGFLIGYPGS